jgi:multidrug efflux pump subunit AcrB
MICGKAGNTAIFAFVLAVIFVFLVLAAQYESLTLPLVWAIGAGAELRQTLGTAVFSGTIGVAAFGLIFTPAFYVVCWWIATRFETRRAQPAPTPAE